MNQEKSIQTDPQPKTFRDHPIWANAVDYSEDDNRLVEALRRMRREHPEKFQGRPA